MKRILAVFLLAAILIVPAAAASDFTDVPENHWAYEYIRNAVDGGLVNGVGDGRFEPEGKVTGFEFAAMVERAVYQDELRDAQADEAWYQPYVDIAKSHGLLTNGLDNLAVLSQPISRYQMAVILFNILDEAGVVTRENGEVIGDAGKVIITYEDAHYYIGDWAQIPAQYRDAVLVCYAESLMNGTDANGTFSGSADMTRAEGAKVALGLHDYFILVVNRDDTEQPTAPEQPAEPEQPADEQSGYAAQVAALVNDERAAEGLAPLQTNDLLQQAAQQRAQEIAEVFAHDRPDGTSCFTVLTEYGVSGYSTAGENIAAGQGNPETVMNSWMNSPGHRANIMNGDFDTIGVGCAEINGRLYWVQLFLG